MLSCTRLQSCKLLLLLRHLLPLFFRLLRIVCFSFHQRSYSHPFTRQSVSAASPAFALIRAENAVVFVYWCPDSAPVRSKMTHRCRNASHAIVAFTLLLQHRQRSICGISRARRTQTHCRHGGLLLTLCSRRPPSYARRFTTPTNWTPLLWTPHYAATTLLPLHLPQLQLPTTRNLPNQADRAAAVVV